MKAAEVGTEGGATLGRVVIDHFKVKDLKKENSRLPFGGGRESFPWPACPRYLGLPSSGMEVSEAVSPTRDPRLQPAPQDELYVAGRGRLSISERIWFPRRRGPRRTRFSLSQQAGKACSPREQKAGGLEAPGACRKPELPATSSARRGGGEPSKPPRRRAVRIPEEKPLWK